MHIIVKSEIDHNLHIDSVLEGTLGMSEPATASIAVGQSSDVDHLGHVYLGYISDHYDVSEGWENRPTAVNTVSIYLTPHQARVFGAALIDYGRRVEERLNGPDSERRAIFESVTFIE